MENLLESAFDALTSTSVDKVRRGLKRLEGLLAQLVLQPTVTARTTSTTASAPSTIASKPTPKTLSSLPYDPAFRAFVALQDSFTHNVCIHLVSCLERLLSKPSSGETDLLIIKTLELLVGCLLIHPQSRELWARSVNVNLFLDLIDPASCPAVHVATLRALTASLLDCPENTRVFEEMGGLGVVAALFKMRETGREVKKEVVEFCYFYLGEEVGAEREGNAEKRLGSAETLVDGKGPVEGEQQEAEKKRVTRTTVEKQAMLSRHLSNVEDLVDDMKDLRRKNGLGMTTGWNDVLGTIAVAS